MRLSRLWLGLQQQTWSPMGCFAGKRHLDLDPGLSLKKRGPASAWETGPVRLQEGGKAAADNESLDGNSGCRGQR